MGLGDIEVDESSQDSSSNSSGSSSGGSSSGSKEQKRVPYLVIYRDRQDRWQYAQNPQDDPDLQLTFSKEDSDSQYELELVPEYFERYFMERSDLESVAYHVEKQLGQNLFDILSRDPREAKRAMTKAARRAGSNKRKTDTERCPVCRTQLTVGKDSYEIIDGRRVCTGHTASDMVQSGFLD